MEDVTLITTLDFTNRPISLFIRAWNSFCSAEKYGLSVIVGFAMHNIFLDNIFFTILSKKFKNITFVHVLSKSNNVNNSLLRNRASEMCMTRYMIFMDIDIWIDYDIIKYMYYDCIDNKFSIIPVLYLSRKGTKVFFKNKNIHIMIDKYFEWNCNLFMHIAIPSSFMCIEKKAFYAINGFDEIYDGHGYEDFDFILRLINYYIPIIEYVSYVDKTYRAPLLSEGFRADIAKFCLDNLLNKHIGIHLFHKKSRNYSISRKKNAEIFNNKFFKNKKIIYNTTVPMLLCEFYKKCKQYGYDAMYYSVLLDNCPKYKRIKYKRE